MLQSIERGRALLYEKLGDAAAWLGSHQEVLLAAAFAILVGAMVWILSGMWHTHVAGKKQMRIDEQARKQAKANRLYEKWLDITLEEFAKGELTDREQAVYDYVVAKALHTEDSMPKPSQDMIQRRVKSFLLWKRTSMDPEAVKLREKHLAKAPIPGPKPGEDVKTVPLAEAAKEVQQSRLARAFSRGKKTAA